MKTRQVLYNSLLFLILTNLLLSCLNDKRKTIHVENKKEIITKERIKLDNDLNYEIEVITQNIQFIVDSLDSRIKLNLGKDYHYEIIYVVNSLRDYGEYSVLYREVGVGVDFVNLDKKINAKLDILNSKLRGGKELILITSPKEVEDQYRVLLNFSRVHFNRKYDEALFTVSLTCSVNTGSDYAVYVKKEDDKWSIRRIILSSIS